MLCLSIITVFRRFKTKKKKPVYNTKPCRAMKGKNLHVCYFFSVTMDDVEAQQDFDDFFEEVFCEIEDKVTLLSRLPFSASTGQTLSPNLLACLQAASVSNLYIGNAQ